LVKVTVSSQMEERIMRRRANFAQRALSFESLEQKRLLAITVLSCGEADPEAVVAEDGNSSSQATESAVEMNGLSDENNRRVVQATADEEDEFESDNNSIEQSNNAELTEHQADDDELTTSGGDQDEQGEADDPEDNDSDENDDESMNDEDADAEEADDDSEDDNDDDESMTNDDTDDDDDDDDTMDDEGDNSGEDDENPSSNDGEEDSTDADESMNNNANISSKNDDTSIDSEDHSTNDAFSNAPSGEAVVAADAGRDEANITAGGFASSPRAAMFELNNAFDDTVQFVPSVQPTIGPLFSIADNREVLELLVDAARREGRELAVIPIDDRAGSDTAPFESVLLINQTDQTGLENPLQPALVDAVFASIA
jgi:hypothetical protein